MCKYLEGNLRAGCWQYGKINIYGLTTDEPDVEQIGVFEDLLLQTDKHVSGRGSFNKHHLNEPHVFIKGFLHNHFKLFAK